MGPGTSGRVWWPGSRHQLALYLLAVAAGAVIGLGVPGAPGLEVAITPVLALLLCATFLGIPFAAIGRAARDGRFTVALVVLDFVLVPVVAYGLSRFVADEPALLFGVLLVLLTPCIDYVIVFSGLAGAACERLLAASPLLVLAQLLLLPVHLLVLVGPQALGVVEVAPFAEAFLVLVALPLTASAATQALARRRRTGVRLQALAKALVVPLMTTTLAVVVASQARLAGGAAGQLARVMPVFAGFLLVMAAVGALTGRAFGLDVPARRALVFSGAPATASWSCPWPSPCPPRCPWRRRSPSPRPSSSSSAWSSPSGSSPPSSPTGGPRARRPPDRWWWRPTTTTPVASRTVLGTSGRGADRRTGARRGRRPGRRAGRVRRAGAVAAPL